MAQPTFSLLLRAIIDALAGVEIAARKDDVTIAIKVARRRELEEPADKRD